MTEDRTHDPPNRRQRPRPFSHSDLLNIWSYSERVTQWAINRLQYTTLWLAVSAKWRDAILSNTCSIIISYLLQQRGVIWNRFIYSPTTLNQFTTCLDLRILQLTYNAIYDSHNTRDHLGSYKFSLLDQLILAQNLAIKKAAGFQLKEQNLLPAMKFVWVHIATRL